jgi:hypothetical protein
MSIISKDKAELRERLWNVFEDDYLLRTSKSPHGKIPNLKAQFKPRTT